MAQGVVWRQGIKFGRASLSRKEFSSVVHPFQWRYNNWGYGLAYEISEKRSRMSWGTLAPCAREKQLG